MQEKNALLLRISKISTTFAAAFVRKTYIAE